MSLKNAFTIIFGKLMVKTLHLLGRDAGNFPGLVLWTINKDCLKAFKVDCPIVAVTGTNGKTSVTNYLSHIFASGGKKIITNPEGNNLDTGICSLLLNHCDMRGRVHADYLVLETDESHVPVVYSKLNLQTLVLLNFFRDQLDRYGEIDITSDIIKRAIKKVPNLKLVLNGDDPLCVQFGREENVKAYYYGISEKVLPQLDDTKEGRFCPVCGEEQKYNYYHYSQLGDFYCPSCGFKRPEIDFEVKNVSLDTPMKFTINNQPMVINYKGFYNIYNLIAVYGALNVLGEKTDDFAKLLTGYKPQIGRMQEYKFNKPVILSLSKNPAGFNQAIATVNTDKRKKDVIIAINDKANDGRDVSWLWVVDFDKIADENLNTLTTTGIRVYDISLRFKYSDIKVDRMTQDMADAITKCLETDSEVVYVLVNYTALYSTEAVLKKLGGEA